ncbi:MAG TPA: type II secretion system protein GspN [Myxococcaceae bacterium]|nr:type II secretion system protein GspN [Myxococcaceae bacterium]
MPPESRLSQLLDRFAAARWRVTAGYAAFSLFAFVFWLYVTFPYQAVRDRVTSDAATQGWNVTIGSLGPGLFGVTAKDVQLRPIAPPAPALDGQAPPKPMQLTLPSVSARPALFPPGVAVRAKLLGGTISGSVGLLGDLKLSASADGLDAADPMLKSAIGVDATGQVDGDASFNLPRGEGPALAATGGFDLSKASGSITITGAKLVVKGGNVMVPLYGQMTPMDLPRVALGDLEGKIKFDKGAGKIEALKLKSEDLQAQVDGTITLGRRLDLSELNLKLKVKTEPELNKRLGLVASALSVLPPDQADPSFRAGNITGYLGRPVFGGFPR